MIIASAALACARSVPGNERVGALPVCEAIPEKKPDPCRTLGPVCGAG